MIKFITQIEFQDQRVLSFQLKLMKVYSRSYIILFAQLGFKNVISSKPPKSQERQRLESKNTAQFRNATKYYNPRKLSGTSNRDEKAPSNQRDDETKIANLNQILSQQHSKLRVLEDKITRNILLYTPKELDKNAMKPKPVPEAIKKIDLQIKQYQRAIERELQMKLMKQQEELNQQALEMYDQASLREEKKQSYDFLTNPQIIVQDKEKPNELRKIEQSEQVQEDIQLMKPDQQDNIYINFTKMQRHYEKQLDLLYIKRDNPGMFSKIKKKNPKIYITGKANQIKKTGEPQDSLEHKMRVYNHENTPCVPQIVIPSFPTRKDQMAQSILAYLKEYSPLVRGDKGQEFPKCIKNILQDEITALNFARSKENNRQNIPSSEFPDQIEIHVQEEDEDTIKVSKQYK